MTIDLETSIVVGWIAASEIANDVDLSIENGYVVVASAAIDFDGAPSDHVTWSDRRTGSVIASSAAGDPCADAGTCLARRDPRSPAPSGARD